jgi:phosphohistidine phosphatase
MTTRLRCDIVYYSIQPPGHKEMKTLCLLRHAHADPVPTPGTDDHDRLLSPRGEIEAENAGVYMREHRIFPDALVCSSSARTKETARIAFDALFAPEGHGVSCRYTRDFYLAPPDVILDEIRQTEDRFACLLAVGHNPGFEDLAEKLAHGAGQSIGRFPPCALAVFDADIDSWRDFSARKVKLRLAFMP